MGKHLTLRYRGFSRQFSLAVLMRLSVAVALTVLVALGSLAVGKVNLSPATLMSVLTGHADASLVFIVEQLRMPRLALAALVGAALAVSGLILQSIIRNPLASPDLLGITSGASAAAVLYLSFFSAALGAQFLPLAAITGAGLAALVIYLLAWNQGASPLRMVLIGVGVSALLAAVTTFILVFSPLTTTLSAYVWLTGSVYGASWPEPRAPAGWLLLTLPLLVLLARQVRMQQLDDDLAQGIGVRVQWLRAGLLLVSVALAGLAVAWGGAIAFVGLIAPHIAKRLMPPGFTGQALMAALIGADLVMLADLAGRTLFLPLDLPAGIFVAVLGTPFFLYLLINQRH
ncbi:iron ABC transporter permease [Pseudomonas syringae pv. actinidiae]|uniref:Permease component n=6 Tax=Pseudomonas syringae TaxID=317 RepID=A0AAN4Q565_PSESF|nr:iron ABC transporter permease [Pseudomonas syringae]AKT30521.1 iron ABC transporter permease [Pseudomonas syringae pv. actinidiae ICMP 18884]AOE56952.1 iron ABC transporter permease [Pseudomonas syringae pv. actinidiae ICMP 18708]APP97912.1 iron ABC transporter permease [Pseudomonas syringae pv. actinidiae]APQ03665.1 iron ABC transporter permease [Pseudomonas syringae pv. actinidiae]AQX59304.1 iron ABC transporter permease [Pseudomonas syringae pv. actinidiae]